MKTAAGKRLFGLSALFCLLAGAQTALAQGYPPYPSYPDQPAPSAGRAYPDEPQAAGNSGYPGQPAPSRNPVCVRLEGQLVALDRGTLDPARAQQIQRYQDAANRQQAELDRVVTQSRRMGCQGLGFFSLFGGQSPQCSQINRKIQEMRANLDSLLQNLASLQNNTADREGQRRSILLALGQNNCGPQYQAAATQPRNFFEALFGPGSILSPRTPYQSSAYRTVCVRTCDGYYFPISDETTSDHFGEDAQKCQRLCPAAEAHLYTYRNPGEEIEQAVSMDGQLYTALPTAFRYRKEISQSCSCRRPGQTWAEALKPFEDSTLEYGDVVVTDENAKQLAQPSQNGAGKSGTKATRTPTANSTAQSPTGDKGTAETKPGKRKVRTVGPVFYPVH
jgi:Protein of unknown function (DUF2865)